MEAFSGLLLKLYRQAQVVPPTEFQARAMDASREALAFDSALWATLDVPRRTRLVAQPAQTAQIVHPQPDGEAMLARQ